MITIKNRIKEYRDRFDLSLRDVEKLTGISNPYILKLEKGMQTPSLKVARKLANAFGTTIEDLFPETDSSGVS